MMTRYIQLPSLMIALASFSIISGAQERVQDRDPVHASLSHLDGKPLHLNQVASCEANGGHRGDFTSTVQGSSLQLASDDATHHVWQASLPITGLGCEVFQADLDGNGREDLIVYLPGIGDRGAYDTRLIILFFDQKGSPAPWQATGRFTLGDGGIEELRRDADGVQIFQTSEFGHAVWDGISYVSNHYSVEKEGVRLESGIYGGIKFPSIVNTKTENTNIESIAGTIHLDSGLTGTDAESPVVDSDPRFLRYGSQAASKAATSNESIKNSEQRAIVHAMIDVNSLAGSEKQIVASDGSEIKLPEILVMDRPDGSRKIIFQPEEVDLAPLGQKHSLIHASGKDCSDPEDCQPFVLWTR